MHDLVELSKMYLEKVSILFKNHTTQSIPGEFAAFIGYALAFPSDFLVLVDTYNVLKYLKIRTIFSFTKF
jgi:nicotinate phosphoribosyltransferase